MPQLTWRLTYKHVWHFSVSTSTCLASWNVIATYHTSVFPNINTVPPQLSTISLTDSSHEKSDVTYNLNVIFCLLRCEQTQTQGWLKSISERFDSERLWIWQFDILRGKFDYNNTITIPIFMITLTHFCGIQNIWTSSYCKNFPTTI